MGKQSRVLRCYHCGAILQCENENEKGYIIPESLHRATPIQIIYCDKCFETMKAFNNSELDQEVDQEDKKLKLAKLYNVLVEHEDIKNYFDLEIAFNKMIYDVNKMIGDVIKEIM